MLSTIQLLDLAKQRAGNVTDYRLSKLLEISPQHVSNYRTGRTRPENSIAMRLAAIAGVDPVEAMAAVNIERATTEEERAAWRLILARCSH